MTDGKRGIDAGACVSYDSGESVSARGSCSRENEVGRTCQNDAGRREKPKDVRKSFGMTYRRQKQRCSEASVAEIQTVMANNVVAIGRGFKRES